MIPARLAPVLFGWILSGLMSLLVSGVSTWRSVGPITGFAGLWMLSWLIAWAIAFPVVLLVAPLTRRAVEALVRRR